MGTENFAPHTAAQDEEAFARDVDIARKDGGLFGGKEAAEKAAERGDTPAPEQQRADGGGGGEARTRDESGRFAPKPEPFAGYNELTPAAKKAFDDLQNDVKREQNRARAAQQQLSQVRPTPRQNQPTPRAPEPKPPAAAAQPPKLDKWRKVETEFPDFHASLEERIAASEGALGRQLTAIEAKQAELDQQLQETRSIADRFAQREDREHREVVRKRLDEWSPNWRHSVGWVDAEGHPIPKDQQAYTREFQAWIDAHAEFVPSQHKRLLEDLASSDPDLMGPWFQKFDQDFKTATGGAATPAGEEGSHATPRANPVVQNRSEALNDRPVRPNGGVPRAAEEPNGQNRPDARFSREEAEFAAVAANKNALERWRGLR